MAQHSRVLVIKLDHIGDFAVALPGLKALANQLPPRSLDVVVSPVNLGWKEVLPWLGDFYSVQFPGYQAGRENKTSKWGLLGQLLNLRRQLHRKSYTAAVDLRATPSDWRGKLVCWLSGAPRRIGDSGQGDFFLNEFVSPPSGHQTDILLAYLKVLEPSLVCARDNLVTLPPRQKTGSKPHLLLHPGAGYPSKLWPLQSWVKLAALLQEAQPPLTFQFIGGPKEKSLIAEICRTQNLAPENQIMSSNLRQTLEHLSNADLLIGLDSASVHLAYLAGTPCITLFSAANQSDRWRSLGDNTVLQTFPECHPCFSSTCRQPRHLCMEEITPEWVFRTISEKLSKAIH